MSLNDDLTALLDNTIEYEAMEHDTCEWVNADDLRTIIARYNEPATVEHMLKLAQSSIANAFESEGEAWSDKLSGDRLASVASNALEPLFLSIVNTHKRVSESTRQECSAIWSCPTDKYPGDENSSSGIHICVMPVDHGGPHVDFNGVRWHETGRLSSNIGEFYPPGTGISELN